MGLSDLRRKPMRVALFWSTIVVVSTAAGAAVAADSLKGTYSLVGVQTCLTSPAGFKQDSKGNLTIPIGNTNASQLTQEGQVIYHGDGTGEVRLTFVTIVPPHAKPNEAAVSSDGSSVAAGTVEYSFTYAPEGEHTYRMAIKPGTHQGMLDAGPWAGQQFSIEGESRLIRVSDDRKKISAAIDKPYLQKITFSGSPQPFPRVCTSIFSQSLVDESAVTVGQSR
jgi:hypothetical protein